MKKLVMSVLKALGYFGIFLGVQLVVPFVYYFAVSFAVGFKYGVMGYNTADAAVILEMSTEITERVLHAATLLTVISDVLTIGVFLLIICCTKQKVKDGFSIRKFSPATVAPLIMMGLGFNVLTSVLLSLLPFPESWMVEYEASSSVITDSSFFIMLLLTVFIAPVAEELTFRALIHTRLKKGMPTVVAAVLSSVLFGLVHGQKLWILYTALVGLVMVWVFERTQSILASILFHMSFNLYAALTSLISEDAPDAFAYVILAVGAVFLVAGMILFMKQPKAKTPVEKVLLAEGETTDVEKAEE